MIVQVVYCTHQTTGLDVREKLAFSSTDQLARAYRRLRADFPRSDVVLLSTCNRVELYTVQEDPQDAPTPEQLARFLSEFHHVPQDQFLSDLLRQTGRDAVRHLFQVVSSLDSMVLGEPQIVNQVKEAYRVAIDNEACGVLTNALFQGAIRVSKRVRSETRLAEGRVSIASVAVGEFAKSIFDRFDDKRVLVLGAGEMAEETLRYLQAEGARHITVVNRSFDRAARLAAEFGAVPRPLDDLDDCLAEADLIVSATGAGLPVVDAERFGRIRARSGEKPVFVLDLGAPRDFAPAVGHLDENVFLYDIDHLRTTCERNRVARAQEIEKARAIIDEEADRFMHDVYHQATGPIIKRLRDEWHDVRAEEVDRLFAKLAHLDERDRREIERAIERIINKLLHPPLEALRDEARSGTPHGLMDALKRLFGIGD
ncbi:MAG: glutamyl-tRNA reductase [Planctomycetales bacterium]